MASGQTIKRGPTLEKKTISAASGPVYFVTFSFFFFLIFLRKKIFSLPLPYWCWCCVASPVVNRWIFDWEWRISPSLSVCLCVFNFISFFSFIISRQSFIAPTKEQENRIFCFFFLKKRTQFYGWNKKLNDNWRCRGKLYGSRTVGEKKIEEK